MSLSRGESVFGVLLIFLAVHFRLKKKKIVDCDCEFSCVYLSFHSDFICCVLRDLHADSLVGSDTPPLRLLLFGMFTNRIIDWFHLLFFLR